MAVVERNMKTGCDAGTRGDRTNNVTTGLQNLNNASNQTFTDRTYENPGGRILSLDNATDITFDHCTFRRGALNACLTGAYNNGIINGNNATRITFTRCVFEDMASVACVNNRNDLIFFDAIDGFYFKENLVDGVASINPPSSDNGNRAIKLTGDNGFGAVRDVQIDHNCFIDCGRNALQINRARGMTGWFNDNVVIGSEHQNSTFEDMVNFYSSAATSGSHFGLKRNYFRDGGPSRTGTGFILGDGTPSFGTTEYIDAEDNVLINTGHVGVNLAGGRWQRFMNNIMFSVANPTVHSTQTGWRIRNDGSANLNYTGVTPAGNVMGGNRVWWGNSQLGSGTNHNWFPDNHLGWDDQGGNVIGDTSLNLDNLSCVNATNDTYSIPTGTAVSDDQSTNDESFFAGDTYAVTGGNLPPGTTMNSDGTVTGTATTPGTYTFTYQVTNILGETDTATVTYIVDGDNQPTRTQRCVVV